MYLLVTGEPPYKGESDIEILEHVESSSFKINQKNLPLSK